MRRLTIALALLGLLAATPVGVAGQPDPIDCEGPAGDPAPETPEWVARDANNIFCSEQRHLDRALHPAPVIAAPVPQAINDAYREPSRHAGARFRFQETTIDGMAAEIYRPCAAGTCQDMPPDLRTFEPPYPAVISLHGGLSRKELHWWSSQPLAEAGYLVVSFTSAGTAPTVANARAMLDWLLDADNPLSVEVDPARIGLAGHSAGGVVSNALGHVDPRVSAIVSWDRAQSTVLPADVEHRTPSLLIVADYNCQQVPVCQPVPHRTPPDPEGPGNKGQDFEIMRAAGVDAMKIALRAALHLDWVPSELSGNRYAEIVTVYYTLAWFDRYLKGPGDPATAQDAFERLTAAVFDGSADRHNISQGHFDPVLLATSGDLYGGNVPYTIEGMQAADRLSFYHLSKCFLTEPGTGARAESDDLRTGGCAAAP